MIKTDLHTHSVASPDGSISSQQYKSILSSGVLDCIAITDHNRIDFALKMQAELGRDKIIVGEEINTNQGEIIGLFLHKLIEPNQDIADAIKAIKSQNGIVYIPHPFETVRSGITKETLELIKDSVDLIESANGRAYFQNFGPEALSWAGQNDVPTLAASDAHRAKGLGKTYSEFPEAPTMGNIILNAKNARLVYSRPSLLDILAPKLNRLRKLIK